MVDGDGGISGREKDAVDGEVKIQMLGKVWEEDVMLRVKVQGDGGVR